MAQMFSPRHWNYGYEMLHDYYYCCVFFGLVVANVPIFVFVYILWKSSDAEDAVKARDGYDYDGYRLRVEFPRGGGPGSYRGSRGSDRNRGEGRSNRGPVTKRSQYRVLVSGLPPSGSWQDLKDHMREAGDVCFADTYKDGTGVVEFLRLDDMKYAIKKLDDSRFRSHEVHCSESFCHTFIGHCVVLVDFEFCMFSGRSSLCQSTWGYRWW